MAMCSLFADPSMSASLAEANVEITQRGAVLEKKERMLAKLQVQYDSVLAAEINNARSVEASSASLMKELSDERSAMDSLKAHTE